ncbi:PE-PPE domain-containing protein [Mycobacterium interjectum]|uniref:PE-PPE domain-containing protein n=1 Tax=Mycobacterium interjectum TaxID=33895 RepID=UPI00082BC358|nr:PE-PPE domain-containing protein [Mycobacterium interjectum]MCV7090639.1 PE-PPE domain-containing protein [Mycobacterium interjectum]
MTNLVAQPEIFATAAQDASTIGWAINDARVAAAGSTTNLAAAAEDEVSAITAQLFGSFGQEYQALLQQAAAFHGQFVATLAGAGNAYAQAEAQIAGTLGLTGAAGGVPFAAVQHAADPAVDAILIMTGSGTANPPPSYVTNVTNLYLQNFTSALTIPVTTAEGLYPFTGVKDLTLDISLARGVTSLNNAITGVLGVAPSAKVVSVLGYSQSSIIASLEMPKLLAQGYTSSNAYFTLLGDPANPNGGLLSRFPGLSFPSLGVTFGTSTPSNDFPTTIWSLEYDGFADFPRYPIDIFSDLNALAGIVFIHGSYPHLTQATLNTAITLGQSGNPSMTTYNMIPTENLPLLAPLRLLPVIGNPLADLIQPDLKLLVNWGYGDPNYGWSTSPADIQTPFGFLPPLSATTELVSLFPGATAQGVSAFSNDLSNLAASLPGAATSGFAQLALPPSASLPTTPTGIIQAIESANTNIVGTLTADVSTAYGTLLPTADIATAVVVTLPSYDVNLFLDGITQAINGDPVGGLVNAFGRPIAADVGLVTLAGGFELINFVNAGETIFTGVPNPGPQ